MIIPLPWWEEQGEGDTSSLVVVAFQTPLELRVVCGWARRVFVRVMALETVLVRCLGSDIGMGLRAGLDGGAVHAEIVSVRTTGYERKGSQKKKNAG